MSTHRKSTRLNMFLEKKSILRQLAVSNSGIPGNFTRWGIMILPERDLQLAANPTDFVLTAFTKEFVSATGNGASIKYIFSWGLFDNYYYSLLGNKLNYNTKEVRAGTNVTIPFKSTLDTKLVVVITEEVFSATSNDRWLKVVSVSNAFKFKMNFINITLNKSSYKPGETLRLNFAKQAYANPRIPKELNGRIRKNL
jgi:hypothetical protein